MPYSVKIHDDLGLVVARLWGSLDLKTFMAYFDTIESLGPFGPEYNFFLKIDPAAELDFPTDAVMDSARRPTVFHDDATRVILASEHLAYGLSRVFVSSAGPAGKQYIMARTLNEAARALNLAECALEKCLCEAS